MDSSRIKRLATGAREELMREVAGKLDAVLAPDSPERLSNGLKVGKLDKLIEEQGRDSVIEAGAYTWFNRLCALRFMDANGYTPVPVVTPREGSTMPAILADAAQGAFEPEYDFDAETRERVVSLLSGSTQRANATEAAYTELLRTVCTHYAKPMSYLFSEDAASSLLMPQGLLSEGSILGRIVAEMDANACSSVEVLGWLYQFYIAERHDQVYASFKKKKKAGPAEIGPATQLFTPEWIVRYLCENSLGRLWMLNNPGSSLADNMDYYIAPESDEPHVGISSAEEIRVLDPACGSGHILVYAFDVLYAMYEEEGWLPEDIPAMILKNNLKGLEIDARAAEIAKFALEMKALEHDPRFLERDVDADVAVLRTVVLDEADMPMLSQAFKERIGLIDAMAHMGEIGSLYVPTIGDAEAITVEIERLASRTRSDMFADDLAGRLGIMLENVEALSGDYHCVIANPPYLGNGNMSILLSGWCKDNYPDEKGDLCTCFINRSLSYAKQNGYASVITSDTCMYISTFEKMRKKLLNKTTVCTFIDTRGVNAHPDVFDANAGWVLRNGHSGSYYGAYYKLDQKISDKDEALREAIGNPGCGWSYRANSERFLAIPGSPIAYWVTDSVYDAFSNDSAERFAMRICKGGFTGENAKYLRLWYEVSRDKTPDVWQPYSKGGSFRRWYGNSEYVIYCENDGAELKSSPRAGMGASKYYGLPHFVWSGISSGIAAFRYDPDNVYFDDVAPALVFKEKPLLPLLGLLNSIVIQRLLKLIAPTMHFQAGDIKQLPVATDVLSLSDASIIENIDLCKLDWDSFETSWDFERHPLVRTNHVVNAFELWESECRYRFDTLKANEEELNRIFARIYGMEGEVPIEVPNDKVSVRLADLQRDVKSLISYGVGCIFGRYSLDVPGLVLADQGSTVSDYLTKIPDPALMPDEDNILPVLDAEWFDDDIVIQFYRFLAAAYGESTLDENVAFIENALGCDLRTYFVRDFYADHVKTYQKRPIYWLFQSPKKSFSCLVYMHRYNEGTVGELLTKYLRAYEEKLRLKIQVLGQSERAADLKTADRYRAQLDELEAWEKDVVYPLAHERVAIDLDDGVQTNYNKFPCALAKVQGLSEWK